MNKINEFLSNKGDLHDCIINAILWDFSDACLKISIDDLNANFYGLPEYLGMQPAHIVFYGIKSIQIDISAPSKYLRIYEASFSDKDPINVITILFSPSGKLVLQFTAMTFPPY